MRAPLCVAALVLASCTPAYAQQAPPTCAPFDDALRVLQREWGERPIAMAQADQIGPLIVLSGPDGASWTILVLRTDGLACIAATGQRWQPVTLPAGDPS